ncbi:hypothetical protein [Asanoa ishikariensis]|nr:hypothetical protein [Asanoa ishikariensis]
MAYRTWGRVLLAALGVGLLAGAGQLGFAYGLGVVRFARDFEQSPGQWTAHLAWVAWFAMLAAVAGALAGHWLAARDDLRPTLGSRVAVAVAGGVGAMAVAPLAMLPSRVATISSGSAVTIAGLSAVLGALVGVFAAVAVLSQRVAGLNLGAVTVVVWLVALLSVAPSLGPDDPLPEVRLGVLDATWLGDGLAQRLAVIVMPALALAAGAGIGALARWRGLPVIPVAVSGVVGPALLALAYLIAGPGDDPDRYQAAPYWGALIAVAAGGLGSVLAAVARQLTGERAAASAPGRHGDHTAEVFPGHGADDTMARDEEPRTFDAWGTTKPGDSESRWGDDTTPTSSFDRGDVDPPPAKRDDDLFGTGTIPGRDDPLGGSGLGRARDLGDVERSVPPRVGDGPTSGSLFNPPTPVAPPRQPEVVSPPPGPEPTPIRPFDRQPASGPGDWRTDKTSSFTAASVPVVPANGPQRRDDGDLHQRPTAIRPQPPTPSRVPRQPGAGDADGLAPIDLPTGSGRHGGPVRLDDPAQTSGAGHLGGSGRLGGLDDLGQTSGAGPFGGAGRHGGPGRVDDPARTSGAGHLGGAGQRGGPGRVDNSAQTSGAGHLGGAGQRGGAGRVDDPAQTSGAGSSGWSGRPDWPGASTPPAGRPTATTAPAQADGEMPDWRLAPPAWTPPPPITPGPGPDLTAGGPGMPPAGPSARVDAAPPAEATAPAKAPEQKRRGLFRRKNKSEPATPAPTTDSDWVDVPTATSSAPADPDDAPGGNDQAPTGPRGFGFGGLVSGRFGGGDQAAETTGAWAGRDSGTPDSHAGSFDADSEISRPGHDADSIHPRFGGGPAEGRPHLGSVPDAADEGGRRSWADRARGAEDQTPAESAGDGGTRGGRRAGRSDRHLRSVDLGGDAGSWDIDDPEPAKPEEDDDAKADAGEPAPSRGLFRRNRNNTSEVAETPAEPESDPAPESTRGRRGKGSDKPIGERDEEYVDWVTGLGAPEPVNERRRDDVPRRSLRSTTQKDD